MSTSASGVAMHSVVSTVVRAVSVEQAARMYGLGKTTIRGAIRSGALSSYRIGRRVLLKVSDLDSWLESGRAKE